MGFLDKAKAAAEQAAAKAKEGVDDVQTRRELGQAYNELGKTAFELIGSGDVSHPRLEPTAAKIRLLADKLAATGGGTGAGASAETDSYDSSQPPATPS
jgi:hypothetical protein